MPDFFKRMTLLLMSFGWMLMMGHLTANDVSASALSPVDYVNPFIGTTNYGTTNPGAVRPNGLMSVSPFNVMGSRSNRFDKDRQWWSTPYDHRNVFLTGFSHVNLSGVGCPDLGSLLLMPTTGPLNPDYTEYGSSYTDEKASPGYYSVRLSKYDILAEATSTLRTGRTRFTFPAGESNILLNLGEGLTNESGATVRFVSDNEVEGSKLLGGFCYVPHAVFPVYFVMKVHKKTSASGYWKKMRPMGVEAQWDSTAGAYKMYRNYRKEMSGDDVGVWMSFNTMEGEQVEVSVGVSFVSVANARLNLAAEQSGKKFEELHQESRKEWNDLLSRINVEGGTDDQTTIFYTALYHALIHPNILQDVNGEYPAMESHKIKTTNRNRYTVFSLWDTYRNVHQLLTLVYPERQMDMLHSMLDIYREHGWLPKWELYGRETLTMEGDPAIPVIVDSWMKGLRDFDIELAYEAMFKSATTPGASNLLRPHNDYYMRMGYIPLLQQYDNSVSDALEYYVADNALSTLAAALGKKADERMFRSRSLGYRKYYCPKYGLLRPRLENGTFYSPFNPMQGENFEPSPGFHEGNAWNYTFYVPHDVQGLIRLMGGKRAFVDKLQSVFDRDIYDPTNEPDIAYPYLFSYFPDEAWRTQREVRRLLNKYYKNAPDGLPGNDDTGTLSSWALFSMMGFYPDVPGVPEYTLTTPSFKRITIQLDKQFHGVDRLVIETSGSPQSAPYTKSVMVGGRKWSGFRIKHDALLKGEKILFQVQEQPSR
jgi:predicted alpha-1,2-mannosidase